MADAVVEQVCHPASIAEGAVAVSLINILSRSAQLDTVKVIPRMFFERLVLEFAEKRMAGAPGGVVSTVHVCDAVVPVFPAVSIARTRRVCDPSESEV
jgi:hypothetical protein